MSQQQYSDEDILEMLRVCKDTNGKCTPRLFEEMEDTCEISEVVHRFGSWPEAKLEAGIEDTSTKYSDEEILDMLKTCKQRHGKCTPRLFKKDDENCSVSLVMRRFGSWSKAKEMAGIDDSDADGRGQGRKYTEGQILSHLKELERREGKVTTEALSKHDDLVSPSVVVERFGTNDPDDPRGGWRIAKERAEVVTTDERSKNGKPIQYSDEDIIEKLRECEVKHGKVTQRVFDGDPEMPSSGTVARAFGSFSEGKEAAGLGKGSSGKYTKDEIIEMLRECEERFDGGCSATKFASVEEYCSPETVQRRFGSWNRAKKAAGLKTSP